MAAIGPEDDALTAAVSAALAGPHETAAPTSRSLVLVKDTLQVSGIFLMPMLLKLCLQLGHKEALQPQVVLVPVEQSVDKYRQVLRKLGMGLQSTTYLDKGQLAVIEGAGPLPDLVVRLNQAAAHHSDPSLQPAPSAVTYMVDSVTDLESVADSLQQWVTFNQYLTSLGSHAGGQPFPGHPEPCVNVVLRVHADVQTHMAQQALLQHVARLVLDVQPLPQPMADIHGQVVLLQRCLGEPSWRDLPTAGSEPAAVPQAPLELRRQMLFKATDLGVRWITQLTARDLLWS